METKKSKVFDLESKRKLFFTIGLSVSLAITLSAFEWRIFEYTPKVIDSTFEVIDLVEELPPVQTEREIPAAKQESQVLNDLLEVIDNRASEPIEQKNLVTIEEYFDPSKVKTVGFFRGEEEEEEDDLFVLISEEMPEFPGGEVELMKYLGKNIKYPQRAKERGIQGKVYVQFIVEKNGKISNVKVMNEIGGGCEDEALRVIKNMPNWTPGKQRKVPVRVQLNLPIVYRLG